MQMSYSMRRSLPLALAALLALGSAWSVAAAEARPAWVIPETLNVRSGPGTDRDLIGSVTMGTKLYVTAFANNWCWARLPNGKWGWVAEWHLQFSWDKGRKLAEQAGASAGSGSSSDATPAWIKEDVVNVRSGPGTNHEKRGQLHRGDKVYIVGRDGDWRKCRTPGGHGWMRRDLLETDPAAGQRLAASGGSDGSGATAKAYVTGSRVHLRKGPGTSYDIKAKLVEGQTLYVTDTRGDWCRARVHGGDEGWIAARLIKYENGNGTAATPSTPSPQPASSSSGSSSRNVKDLTAWIGEDRVNVRYGPGLDNGVKMKLSRGTKVRIVDISGHWCKVKTDAGKVGWVAGWVMNFKEPDENVTVAEGSEDVEARVGWVARPEVNVRAGPGLDQKEIAEAVLGTKVILLDQKADWYKVALDNGTTGWMASWLIDTREQRIARKGGDTGSFAGRTSYAASPIGRRFVETAMRYRGTRYVRGGSGPSGFDCSGFVSYVLRQHGVHVSRDSRALFQQGKPVSRGELQAGDVVFFRNTYRRGISHVGIYIGGADFVHASNRRGGVKVSSLDSDYYAPRYAGARRMR